MQVFYHSKFRAVLGALALLLCAAGCREGRPTIYLDIATTTSVRNAGLLDAILPFYGRAVVRAHAAGSGRSLEMLADGIVELVITHAPAVEARYLQAHPGWNYRKLAHNAFVVVGPRADPAAVHESSDVIDAFRRIAAADVWFVSRGDQSGTHEREQALWGEAAVSPAGGRLIISGNSMAVTLRHADERRAYTLTDDATFRQLQPALELVAFDIPDHRLVNSYAVVYPADNANALAFAEWLTRGAGRDALAAYRVGGETALTPWPEGCADARPQDLPC